MSPLIAIAQTAEKSVTLVTSGEGVTKEEAVKQALRSAIEQTFGTFVSANTEVLNDELISDEVVTVSTGNIIDYRVIDCLTNKDGSFNTTVEVTVSIGKLTNFAKSKGVSVDIAAGAFVMNMKIRELNKQNELQAIKDLNSKLYQMVNCYNLFDYQLKLGEPYLSGDNYAVEARVDIVPNINLANFRNTIISTLKSLSLSEVEREEYERAKIPYRTVEIAEYSNDQVFLSNIQANDDYEYEKTKPKRVNIYLRNCDYHYPTLVFPWYMLHNELGFGIVDDIENSFSFFGTNGVNSPKEKYLLSYVRIPIWPVSNFEEKWRNDETTIMKYWFSEVIANKEKLFSLVEPKRYRFYVLDDNFAIVVHGGENGGFYYDRAPAYFKFELKYPKEIFSTLNNVELILNPPTLF